jgi:hypothetical protein
MEIAGGPRDWENAAVYARNKCKSHVPLRAHPSPESALQYYLRGPAAASNPHVISLNGPDWAFKLFDRPESVPKAFWEAAFDEGQWGKVGSSCTSP